MYNSPDGLYAARRSRQVSYENPGKSLAPSPPLSPPRRALAANPSFNHQQGLQHYDAQQNIVPLEPGDETWQQTERPGSAGGTVGPTAQRWVNQQAKKGRHRRSSMIDSLRSLEPSTVVVHDDGTAGREQTRWNAWLAEGEQQSTEEAYIPEHQRLQESSDEEEEPPDAVSPSPPSEDSSSAEEFHDPDTGLLPDPLPLPYSRPTSAAGSIASRQISPDPQQQADLLQQIHAAGLQHADLLRQLHASGLQQATDSSERYAATRASSRRSFSNADHLLAANPSISRAHSMQPVPSLEPPVEHSWQRPGSHLRKQSSLPTSPRNRIRSSVGLRKSRSDAGELFQKLEPFPGHSPRSDKSEDAFFDALPGLSRPPLHPPAHGRQPSFEPVYLAGHSKVPSADIGALHLTEYFSPLSLGMSSQVSQRPGIPTRLGRPADNRLPMLEDGAEGSASTAGNLSRPHTPQSVAESAASELSCARQAVVQSQAKLREAARGPWADVRGSWESPQPVQLQAELVRASKKESSPDGDGMSQQQPPRRPPRVPAHLTKLLRRSESQPVSSQQPVVPLQRADKSLPGHTSTSQWVEAAAQSLVSSRNTNFMPMSKSVAAWESRSIAAEELQPPPGKQTASRQSKVQGPTEAGAGRNASDVSVQAPDNPFSRSPAPSVLPLHTPNKGAPYSDNLRRSEPVAHARDTSSQAAAATLSASPAALQRTAQKTAADVVIQTRGQQAGKVGTSTPEDKLTKQVSKPPPLPPPLPKKAAAKDTTSVVRTGPPPPPPPPPARRQASKGPPPPSPPPPPAGPSKGGSSSNTAVQAASPGIASISVADLAGARLKKAPATNTHQQKPPLPQGAGRDELLAEIRSGAVKLRSVAKGGPAAPVHSKHESKSSSSGMAAIFKRAQDIRASFYPESTIGSESDWED